MKPNDEIRPVSRAVVAQPYLPERGYNESKNPLSSLDEDSGFFFCLVLWVRRSMLRSTGRFLYRCLAMLSGDERELMIALYSRRLTERTYAELIGVSKTAVHERKVKVLSKIKTLIEKIDQTHFPA